MAIEHPKYLPHPSISALLSPRPPKPCLSLLVGTHSLTQCYNLYLHFREHSLSSAVKRAGRSLPRKKPPFGHQAQISPIQGKLREYTITSDGRTNWSMERRATREEGKGALAPAD